LEKSSAYFAYMVRPKSTNWETSLKDCRAIGLFV
jgi:hypothetical protein